MLENPREWKGPRTQALDFDPTLTELLSLDHAEQITLPVGTGPVWLFTHYDALKAVTNDPRFSRSAVLSTNHGRTLTERPLLDDDPSYQDGEVHARTRRALARVLAPAHIGPLQARAESVAARLVAELCDKGPPTDLVMSLTSPFAMETACAMVGIAYEDWDGMQRDYEVIFNAKSTADQVRLGKEHLAELFAVLVEKGRSHPSDNLIGVLASAEGADRLTDAQVIAALFHVAHTAWSAVSKGCGNLLYILLSRPREWEWLCSNPQALPGAIEELLRYIPRMAGVGVARIATEDVRVGGVTVARGEAAYVSYAAANRDPRVFEDPHRLDLTRKGPPHVAYGYGPHHCPASAVATMELRTLMRAVLSGLPSLRLAVAPDEVPWRPGNLVRGPLRLPVEW